MWIPTHQGEKLSTNFFHRKVHYSDDPAKDAEWVRAEALKYGGVNSVRWQREMEITQAENAIKEIDNELSRKPEYQAMLTQAEDNLKQVDLVVNEQKLKLDGLRQQRDVLNNKQQQLFQLEQHISAAKKDIEQ